MVKLIMFTSRKQILVDCKNLANIFKEDVFILIEILLELFQWMDPIDKKSALV